MTTRPNLVIPVGDPAGIGTEVVLKALADPTLHRQAAIAVLGHRDLLTQTYERLRTQTSEPLANPADLTIAAVDDLTDLLPQVHPGTENRATGALSFTYLERAIAATLAGSFDGIVTAPISKAAWQAAGHDYPGQTELLATRSQTERYGMLFVARSPHTGWTLRTLLATTHIPLSQVPQTLNPDLMTRKLDLLVACLAQDFGLSNPRIAIAGLNPHSGEQGNLGQEEQTWLSPWLAQMRDRYPHLHLEGLTPPDTLWVKPGQAWFGSHALTTPAADAYLALYHDQGLIPVKLMAFDRAVNTSIGLPFVRTSPDHGTAFDIAGRGIADASSMKAAIQLATELCDRRSQPKPHATIFS